MTPTAQAQATCRPSQFRTDVWTGLGRTVKELPAKYFYDRRGSQLFDAITELPEYYPTRTELQIMQSSADEMVKAIGPDALLVEYGSGSSLKTQVLLDAAQDSLAAYVPVDISGDHLIATAEGLRRRYPRLEVLPVAADFTQAFHLPRSRRKASRTVGYFPGSTIGNFLEDEAIDVLGAMAETIGEGGGLLIGVDLVKDANVLRSAYNDAQGVTAEFNKNVLARINRELSGNFDLDAFEHEARWMPRERRIEMHLVSRRDQVASVAGRRFAFRRGESICTEYSHKYTLESFARLAAEAGWRVERVWTDPNRAFSVQYLVRDDSAE